MTERIEFKPEKFQELIVYLAHRLGPEAALGPVKVAKLLMHSDFTAFQRLGAPITGATYEKWEHGHLPRELLLARRDLEAAGAIREEREDYFGKTLNRLVALRDPDLSGFSEDELAIVEGALKQYGHESAAYLSELSHQDPGWILAEDKEVIPFETALIGTGRPPESVFEEFRELHGITA